MYIEPGYLYAFIVITALALIISIGFFFALVFPNRVSKNIKLFSVNSPYVVEGVESNYIKSVHYSRKEHAIVIFRIPTVRAMTISLITQIDGSRSERVIDVDFSNGDIVVIPVEIRTSLYRIFVRNVDGNNVKSVNTRKPALVATIVYSVLVAVFAALALIMYALYGASALNGYYYDYAIVYVLSIIMPFIIIVGANVGMYFLINKLMYRGGR